MLLLDGADPFQAPLASGCLYLDDDRLPCGVPQQFHSPYCAAHHALCHLIPGSLAEQARIAQIDAIGKFVGGRVVMKSLGVPPQRFMRALDARQRKR